MLVKNELENLHYIKLIYSAILKNDKSLALEIFDKMAVSLFSVPFIRPDPYMMQNILHSINQGLYYLFLFDKDHSHHDCCNSNYEIIANAIDRESFIVGGEKIISQYNEILTYQYQSMNVHVEKAMMYIEENIDKNLTLEEVAGHIPINKTYLSQLFRTHMGTTFTDYLLSRKVNKAEELLIATNKAIKEVAEICGFRSQTYFATLFKRITGYTPNNYRKMRKPKYSLTFSKI